MIIGLDVGGANTKLASSDGKLAQVEYLPLWKNAPLETLLNQISDTTRPQAIGVVMTGELADCFPDKMTGIKHIKEAVENSFSCPTYFWGVNGFNWHDLRELAAANWSASSRLLSRDMDDCIFVDMGSTTTDLIPIKGEPQVAHTDYQRLARGELIYSGLLRTNLAALLHSARIDGQQVPLSSEFFAITADVYLALGEISENDYTCETPDCGKKDRISALRRLARTVCADLEEIGKSGAMAIAFQAKARQQDLLMHTLDNLARTHKLNKVVAAGSGEGLIVRASQQLDLSCTRLSDKYGAAISRVFPAYAAARLVEIETSPRTHEPSRAL
ncbi:MAG: hydantoinase/oxoprolinase family protein [Methanotrichaceae archaeon]